MDKEIQDMLNDLPNKKFGKLTDNQLAGIEVISQKMRGENNPIHKMEKNPFSDPDFVKKNVEKKKGSKLSKETKDKISNSRKGLVSPNKGKIASDETRKKLSKASKGRKPWNKGVIYDDDVRKKMSEVRKGIPQPHTSKTNNKMNSLKFICPHCNREIGGRANFVRFHNDNCKMKN